MSLLLLFSAAGGTPPEITGSGNASFNFAANGSGVAAIQGDGAAPLLLGAGGTGTVAVAGAGGATLPLTGRGAGAWRFTGHDRSTTHFNQMGEKINRGRMLIEMIDAGVLFGGKILDPSNGPHDVPRWFGFELVTSHRAREVT